MTRSSTRAARQLILGAVGLLVLGGLAIIIAARSSGSLERVRGLGEDPSGFRVGCCA